MEKIDNQSDNDHKEIDDASNTSSFLCSSFNIKHFFKKVQ